MNKSILFFLIPVSALALRLYLILNSSLTFFSDDAIYASIARFWWEHNWKLAFHPTWPPLFPALSAVLFTIVGKWEVSLRLVSAMAATLLIIPITSLLQAINKKHHSIIVSQFVAAVITFSTPLFNSSLVALSDMLSTFFLTCALVVTFLAIIKNNNQMFLVSGAALGGAFLTRPEGTLFFGLSFCYLLTYLVWKVITKQQTLRRGLQGNFFLLSSFLIISSPYLIATRLQLGFWTFSQKTSAQIQQEHIFKVRDNGTTWAQEINSITIPNYQSSYFSNGINYTLKNIIWLTTWFEQKAAAWGNVFTTNLPLWSVAVLAIGIWAIIKRSSYWSTGYLLFIMTTVIPITMFATAIWDIRYLLWTIPLLLCFFYLGINTLLNHFTSSGKYTTFITQILSIVILLSLPIFNLPTLTNLKGYAQRFTQNNYDPDVLEVASWISKNTQNKKPRIMMRHEALEFYTRGITIYLPQNLSYDKLLAYAHQYATDYLVVWDKEITYKDQAAFLLTLSPDSPKLTSVFGNPHITVYKITE